MAGLARDPGGARGDAWVNCRPDRETSASPGEIPDPGIGTVYAARNDTRRLRRSFRASGCALAMKKGPVRWLDEPEDHNYPAALSYLSLIYDRKLALAIVGRLKRARHSEFKAKDIFRASRLSLLGVSNSHVE